MRITLDIPLEKAEEVCEAFRNIYRCEPTAGGMREYFYRHMRETVEGYKRQSAAALCEPLDVSWGALAVKEEPVA